MCVDGASSSDSDFHLGWSINQERKHLAQRRQEVSRIQLLRALDGLTLAA
jgi:hypothetical protein